MKRLVISIGIVVIMIIGVIAYAFYIEPNMLIVRNYNLQKEVIKENKKSNGENSIRIVQFTDVHISHYYTEKKLKKLVTKVNELEADVLVFTGDLFDNFSVYSPGDAVIKQLSQMKAKYGKFCVWGNRDYGGGASRKYETIMEQSGFTILKNSGMIIDVLNGKRLFLGGVDDFLLGQPDLYKTLQNNIDSDYAIVMMHEPDKANLLKEEDINLILAGHSHGGQIRIPFIKAMTTSLAEHYIHGFYQINKETNVRLYVNTGIGTTRIPARFLVPPEISVFTIQLESQ